MGLLAGGICISKEDRVRVDRALDLFQTALVLIARISNQELKVTLNDKIHSNVSVDDIRK